MEDLETRHKAAAKMVLEIRDQLEQLETGEFTGDIFESKISTNISDLSRLIQQLEGLLIHERGTRRDLYKIRIGQLREECNSMRNSFGIYIGKKAEAQRSQLLGRVNKHMGPTSRIPPSSREEQLYKDNESLGRSVDAARDIENQAKSIFGGIVEQNEQIRGMVDKMHSVASTLGISRTIMRVIERRQYTDKLLVYGGMIFVVLLLLVLYFYVR